MNSKDTIMNESCVDCKIYFATETKRPILLICGHNICLACVRKFIIKKCPICKVASPHNWKFPVNVSMINIAKDYRRCLVKTEEVENYNKTITTFKSNVKRLQKKLNITRNVIEEKVEKTQKSILEYANMTSLLQHISNSHRSLYSIYDFQNTFEILEAVTVSHGMIDAPPSNDENSSVDIKKSHVHVAKDLEKFDFGTKIDCNILSVLRSSNCFVGSHVNGRLVFGKVTRSFQEDALQIGVLRPKTVIPEDATLIQLRWLKPLVDSCHMVYFTLVLYPDDWALATEKQNLATVYIKLLPKFMNEPVAKQFYLLCSGEKGESYLNSRVEAKGNVVFVEDYRHADILQAIKDVGDSNLTAYSGMVTVSRESQNYSSFYVHLSTQKLNGDHVNVGYVHSGLEIFQNGNSYIKDCGLVVYANNQAIKDKGFPIH